MNVELAKEIEKRIADISLRNMKNLGISLEDAIRGTLEYLTDHYPEAVAIYFQYKASQE